MFQNIVNKLSKNMKATKNFIEKKVDKEKLSKITNVDENDYKQQLFKLVQTLNKKKLEVENELKELKNENPQSSTHKIIFL